MHKLMLTDFKTEVLFDLVGKIYRRKHGLKANRSLIGIPYAGRLSA